MLLVSTSGSKDEVLTRCTRSTTVEIDTLGRTMIDAANNDIIVNTPPYRSTVTLI